MSDESIPPPSEPTPEVVNQPVEPVEPQPTEPTIHPLDRDPDYDRLLLTRGQDFDLDYTLLVPVLRAHERQQLDLKGQGTKMYLAFIGGIINLILSCINPAA